MIVTMLMMMLPALPGPDGAGELPRLVEIEGGRLYWSTPRGSETLLRAWGHLEAAPRVYRLPIAAGPGKSPLRLKVRAGSAWAVSRPEVAPGQPLSHLLRIAPEVLPDFLARTSDGPFASRLVPEATAPGVTPVVERPLEIGRIDPLTEAWLPAQRGHGATPAYDILPVAEDACLLILAAGHELAIHEYRYRFDEKLRDHRGRWREVCRVRCDLEDTFRVFRRRGPGYLILTDSGSLYTLDPDPAGSMKPTRVWEDPRRPILLAVSRGEDRSARFFGRGFQLRLDPTLVVEEDASIPARIDSEDEAWNVMLRCSRPLLPQP
ncbi:hypothetical protein [Aquisphaera insulae]|uniref:hypothetical protein n=1 Tax=Aquisphaera insulae TaxID=2712864 RepID=UPI0013EDA06E|nr:hypothetical protein [Aquisphaera insulae]